MEIVKIISLFFSIYAGSIIFIRAKYELVIPNWLMAIFSIGLTVFIWLQWL